MAISFPFSNKIPTVHLYSSMHLPPFDFYPQANCIDSTVPTEAVFAQEVKKLQVDQFKPSEQATLEPFERDHACVVGGAPFVANSLSLYTKILFVFWEDYLKSFRPI